MKRDELNEILLDAFKQYDSDSQKHSLNLQNYQTLTKYIMSYVFSETPAKNADPIPQFEIKDPSETHKALLQNIKKITLEDVFTHLREDFEKQIKDMSDTVKTNDTIGISLLKKLKEIASLINQPALMFNKSYVQKYLLSGKSGSSNTNLQSNHALFQPLNKWLKDIQDIIQKIESDSSTGFEHLLESLKKIHQQYKDYQVSVCEQADIGIQKDLLQPMVVVEGLGFSRRLLLASRAKVLLCITDNFEFSKKENKHGNHLVKFLAGNFYKSNLNNRDLENHKLYPGIESAAGFFYQLFAGQGAPPMALLKLKFPWENKVFFVQTTKGVEGENYLEFLHEYEAVLYKEKPSALNEKSIQLYTENNCWYYRFITTAGEILNEAINDSNSSLSFLFEKGDSFESVHDHFVKANQRRAVQVIMSRYGLNQWGLKRAPSNYKIINYSAAFIASLVGCPSDGKADNYIATHHCNKNNELIAIELFSIDNDLTLSLPTYENQTSPKGAKTKEHYLGLRDILYCLPEMDDEVNPHYRAEFLRHSPEYYFFHWLRHIERMNNYYRQGIAKGIFNPDELHEMGLPMKFYSGELMQRYRTIVEIHQMLRLKGIVRHRGLLEKIYPFVAKYYNWAWQQTDDPLIRYFKVHNRVEESDKSNSFKISKPDEMLKIRTRSFNQALSDFLVGLQIKEPGTQKRIMNYLSDFHQATELTFRNFEALEDVDLMRMSANFPDLTRLNLYGCNNITMKGITSLLLNTNNIRLTLGGCKHIDINEYRKIYSYCQEYGHTLLISLYPQRGVGAEDDVKIDINNKTLLHYVLEAGNRTLVPLLIEFGADVNAHDEFNRSPLYLAAKRDDWENLHCLLSAGANMHALNRGNATALDRALQANAVNAVLCLLLAGSKHKGFYTWWLSCKEALLKAPQDERLQIWAMQVCLKELVLDDKIFQKDLQGLFPALKSLTLANSVDLSDAVYQSFSQYFPSVTILDISRVQPMSQKAIASLANNPTLRELKLNPSQAELFQTLPNSMEPQKKVKITTIISTEEVLDSDSNTRDLRSNKKLVESPKIDNQSWMTQNLVFFNPKKELKKPDKKESSSNLFFDFSKFF